MDMLKKFFPYSFGAKDVAGLVIKIVVYLVVSAVLGFVISLIPLVGGLVASLIGVYSTVGIVLAVLDYLKILK